MSPLRRTIQNTLAIALRDPKQREEAEALSKAIAAASVRFSAASAKKSKKGATS